MLKKIFIASSVIFAVLLIFWGVYNFAFKVSPVQKTETEKKETKDPVFPSGAEEPSSSGKIRDISKEGVIAPVLMKGEEEKILFYASLDGRVFSINLDGSGKKVVSSQVLQGISNVIWSPDQKKVLSEFENGARKYAYNYETKTNKPLNAAAFNLAWSNLGDKILYQYSDGKANELAMADPDGSNWKKMADLSLARIKIAPIPQTSMIAFWNHPKSNEETALFSLGVLGGEAKKIFGGKFGADYLFAPNGKKALVSFAEVQNGSKMSSGIIDADGTNFHELKIPTLVSKCAWAREGKTIFCALPGNVPEKAVMPDEYRERKLKTQDTFWSIELSSGEKTRLVELDDLAKSGIGFDAEKLFLSSDERILFFTNRTDGHLYRIDIPKKSQSQGEN